MIDEARLPLVLKRFACLAGVAVALWGCTAVSAARKGQKQSPPQHLRDTGLYRDFGQYEVASRNLEYSPQYPVWMDGATRRRWLYLPSGKSIDASRPDAWVFPVGAKLWQELSFGGRRVETRYLERQRDGTWSYASYAWSEDQREAVLVSDKGQRGTFELGAGLSHDIPSVSDCKVCHEGQRTEVLGFSALQLSSDRDPGALHAEPLPAPGVELGWLARRGLLKRLPRALLSTPPRISAATPTERAALGYLHGNCGHCHNDDGPLSGLGLSLRHSLGDDPQAPERALQSAWGQRTRTRAPGLTQDAVLRIAPGHPETSVIAQRMASRHPGLQMPPLGTVVVDEASRALISRWIAEGPSSATMHEPSGGSPGATSKEGQ